MTPEENPYEDEQIRQEYLLFHFGTREQIIPWSFAPDRGWQYPTDCADLLAKFCPTMDRALDLGCAVGRSSFDLARHATEVIGIDYSHTFVAAAEAMKQTGSARILRKDEGERRSEQELLVDPAVDRNRTHFEQGDACQLRADLGSFDAILMANLIDRLPDPRACLRRLPELVRPGGTVLITSPYTWLEEYTPRDKWLSSDTQTTFEGLSAEMTGSFELTHREDMPFIIREHARKFQWSVAEASVWTRNS